MQLAAAGIDHLIYASSSLERGMDAIERLLGVRPVPGGRHPRFGTHNALLSLGSGTYLEVMASDPGLPVPSRGTLLERSPRQGSYLATWVLRTQRMAALAEQCRASNIGIGHVEAGCRENPDGSELHWQLTDPYAWPMNGVAPFLIDWGDSVHPSTVLPEAGLLENLTLSHPDAQTLYEVLAGTAAGVTFVEAPSARLSATIRRRDGAIVTLS